MLTTVILSGALGKRFGKKWELEVSSPIEALRLIEANCPGVRKWIEDNIRKFPNYRVSCATETSKQDISEKQFFGMVGEFKEIRFIPVVEGSGGAARIVIGAAMFVAGGVMTLYGIPGGEFVSQAGIAMAMGGVVELLSPGVNRSQKESYERKDKTSYYFNGPVNTEEQGVPVPLIYGRVLVGSHPISVNVTVEGVVAEVAPAVVPTVQGP